MEVKIRDEVAKDIEQVREIGIRMAEGSIQKWEFQNLNQTKKIRD